MSLIAKTPEPPYYAVIFTSERGEADEGYASTVQRMLSLAAEQPGYLGVESAREGLGITVSYWRDLASIQNWKRNADHVEAQKRGRDQWYSAFTCRIAHVKREYSL